MVRAAFQESIIARAISKGILEIDCHQIRDYTTNKQGKVDDYPYGGGPGLVMAYQPIADCIRSVSRACTGEKPYLIYLSPQGRPFDQETARRLAGKENLMLLCGHYEGIDERIIEEFVDEEISLGDFVLTGGEIPAMAVADCVARLLPGVLAEGSAERESHSGMLLEYPQYTRPAEIEGKKVPEILLSGKHEEIEAWQLRAAEERTKRKRPDLYDKYAPYIQSQLPDVNIEFVVGNNDLDFYKFLDENGGLPDIITCCRFSLHDASPLKDSLMDLSTTNEAGAVYNTYLNNFMNEDGSVNWLPVCADAHGFVVNKGLFEKYGIELPTDYDSFVLACQKFEEAGVRGFTADYYYDYTCMETLQGLSASELTSMDGRKWRTAYSDPANKERVGLDDIVWPQAFEHMEQFINDVKLGQDDLDLTYDDVISMYQNEELAMYFGTSAMVKTFQDQGIDTAFLPFFNQNGEKWIMTTPYFQIALNKDLEQEAFPYEADLHADVRL